MIKKRIWIPILILGTALILLVIFTKLNPPLEIGTIASNGDGSLIVVGVGNSGIQGITIREVRVNNDEVPSITKIQHSHPMQGFTVADEIQLEDSKFNFKDLSDVTIQTKTSPSSTYKKMDDGIVSEKDEIYGVSALHTETIHRVQLKYNYFGIPFKQTISTENLSPL